MIWRILKPLVAAAAVLLAGAPATAQADAEAPIQLSLEPWSSHDGVDRPYRFIVTARPRGTEPVELVADRRLLSFEVHPVEGRRGRRYRCRHPHAPRTTPEARVRTLRPGAGGEEGAWREWIDLRMYCWGRALRALRDGARVEGRLGWRRRHRRRWVARRAETSWREWTGGVELPTLSFAGVPEPEADTRRVDRRLEPRVDPEGGGSEPEGSPPDGSEPTPIVVDMSPRSARRGSWLSFRASLRAREGRERVYARPDAWSFRVQGPLGTVVCRIPSGGGSPPPDLFRRVSRRGRLWETLDPETFCPEDTFALAGVYEVTPKIRLPHSGEEYDLEAITGRYVGVPTPMRITEGDRGYVEQIPEPADPLAEPGGR